RENCSCRAVPGPTRLFYSLAIVSPVLPKFVFAVQLTGLAKTLNEVQIPRSGVAKFGWFRMLKISARNCSFAFSPNGQFFIPEKSHWKNPGPRRLLRPTLPIVEGSPGIALKFGSIW